MECNIQFKVLEMFEIMTAVNENAVIVKRQKRDRIRDTKQARAETHVSRVNVRHGVNVRQDFYVDELSNPKG